MPPPTTSDLLDALREPQSAAELIALLGRPWWQISPELDALQAAGKVEVVNPDVPGELVWRAT